MKSEYTFYLFLYERRHLSRSVWQGLFGFVHVLPGSDEGEFADVNPAPEGEIDICDGEQDKGDEQTETKHLQGMEFYVDRAEHRS